MKIFCFLGLMLISFCSFVKAEEKAKAKVDFSYDIQDRSQKRASEIRKTKFEVPEILWKLKTPGIITAAPMLHERELIIGGTDEFLYYVDPQSGELQKGRFKIKGRPYFTGVFLYKRIMAVTNSLMVHGYTKGHEKYAFATACSKTEGDRPIGAIWWGGGVLVTNRVSSPIMISGEDGNTLHLSDFHLTAEASAPAISIGNSFLLGTMDGHLLEFDTKLKSVKKKIKLEKGYATALAYEKGIWYICTSEKELIAYQGSTDKILWQKKLKGICYDSMVISGSQLFINAGSFFVFALESGDYVFEQENKAHLGFGITRPVVTSDRVYSCDSDGNLFIFDLKSFRLLQAINLNVDVYVDFIVIDKVGYVATSNGYLVALDLEIY